MPAMLGRNLGSVAPERVLDGVLGQADADQFGLTLLRPCGGLLLRREGGRLALAVLVQFGPPGGAASS
jgi:hypothetical protein